jgi:hypothetical protein
VTKDVADDETGKRRWSTIYFERYDFPIKFKIIDTVP